MVDKLPFPQLVNAGFLNHQQYDTTTECPIKTLMYNPLAVGHMGSPLKMGTEIPNLEAPIIFLDLLGKNSSTQVRRV